MTITDFEWPEGREAAVSLTYDDGLPVHYEHVGPLLETAGIRGTFFVPIKSDIMHNPEQWRQLASRGHELGNHTLFHPCRRKPRHHSWLEAHYDLADYTPARFRQELEIANLTLYLVDAAVQRSYGNTCCDTTIGRSDQEIPMDSILEELFVAARGPFNGRIADVRSGLNLMQVGHFGADGRAFTELKDEIERTREIGGWIVYMIHGIGPSTHNLNIDELEHNRLITWLGDHRETIWTAPFIQVARHVKRQQP